MNKRLSIILLATLALTTATANADAPRAKMKSETVSNYSDTNRYYVRADVGYGISKINVTQISKDLDTNEVKDKTTINKKGKGYLGSIGVGYYATKNVRIEGQFYFDEGFKAKGSTKNGDNFYPVTAKEKTLAGFLNTYYDFCNSTKLTPYLMGGIGFAKNELKYTNADADLHAPTIKGSIKFKKKTDFAYQVGLGASYRMLKNVDVDLGYRLMHKGKNKKSAPTITDPGLLSYDHKAKSHLNHTFLAGIRVTF